MTHQALTLSAILIASLGRAAFTLAADDTVWPVSDKPPDGDAKHGKKSCRNSTTSRRRLNPPVALSEILLVACQNFDLEATRVCVIQTAFVRRARDRGHDPPPELTSYPVCDFVFDEFELLTMSARSIAPPVESSQRG